MNQTNNNTWLESEFGQSFLSVENAHIKQALRHMHGPTVLQLGSIIDDSDIQALDFPQLVSMKANQYEPECSQNDKLSIIADAAYLPFSPDSFSSVILPHVLEGHCLPHQVLREAHRVIRPEGTLLLTGFNPVSLLSMQRYLYPKASPKGDFYTVKRVKDWLQLLGFEVVASAIFQYAPLCKNQSFRNSLAFLNSIGDRWLPMTGGGYMISAKKREVGSRLVGRVKFSPVKRARRKLSTATSVNRRKK